MVSSSIILRAKDLLTKKCVPTTLLPPGRTNNLGPKEKGTLKETTFLCRLGNTEFEPETGRELQINDQNNYLK